MRERSIIHLCERRVRSAMFGVAVAAAQVRVGAHHLSMQRRGILQLSRNPIVTGNASIYHARRLPGSRMTGFAIAADLGVRRDAAKRLTSLGAQGAGVIQ